MVEIAGKTTHISGPQLIFAVRTRLSVYRLSQVASKPNFGKACHGMGKRRKKEWSKGRMVGGAKKYAHTMRSNGKREQSETIRDT